MQPPINVTSPRWRRTQPRRLRRRRLPPRHHHHHSCPCPLAPSTCPLPCIACDKSWRVGNSCYHITTLPLCASTNWHKLLYGRVRKPLMRTLCKAFWKSNGTKKRCIVPLDPAMSRKVWTMPVLAKTNCDIFCDNWKILGTFALLCCKPCRPRPVILRYDKAANRHEDEHHAAQHHHHRRRRRPLGRRALLLPLLLLLLLQLPVQPSQSPVVLLAINSFSSNSRAVASWD